MWYKSITSKNDDEGKYLYNRFSSLETSVKKIEH